MSEKMKEVNLLELEKVTGGTYEELSDIIGLFRKYGYNAEADKLYRSGSVLFEVGFKEVMQSMGYKGGMQVYGSPDEANRYVYNDKWASHGTVMNALEEFLKLKKSGLYDM